MVAQDVEAFASSVSECLQKRHYQSASLNVLNRTVTEKMIFVKDTLTARQRVVQSSVELFSNYDKVHLYTCTYLIKLFLLAPIYNGILSSAIHIS